MVTSFATTRLLPVTKSQMQHQRLQALRIGHVHVAHKTLERRGVLVRHAAAALEPVSNSEPTIVEALPP